MNKNHYADNNNLIQFYDCNNGNGNGNSDKEYYIIPIIVYNNNNTPAKTHYFTTGSYTHGLFSTVRYHIAQYGTVQRSTTVPCSMPNHKLMTYIEELKERFN